MAPPAPSWTTTRMGITVPGAQLRSDASGRVAPSGQTVSALGALVLATVTFRTTAWGDEAPPSGGTPPPSGEVKPRRGGRAQRMGAPAGAVSGVEDARLGEHRLRMEDPEEHSGG